MPTPTPTPTPLHVYVLSTIAGLRSGVMSAEVINASRSPLLSLGIRERLSAMTTTKWSRSLCSASQYVTTGRTSAPPDLRANSMLTVCQTHTGTVLSEVSAWYYFETANSPISLMLISSPLAMNRCLVLRLHELKLI